MRRDQQARSVTPATTSRADWWRLVRPVALAAASTVVLASCSRPGQQAPPPPQVTVASAIARDITEWDEFTGRFAPVEAVEIRPRVSGYIEHVTFKEGDEVHVGDVLFRIDDRQYVASLQRAEAELTRVKSQASLAASQEVRAQRLVDVQAISREEYDARASAQTEGAAGVRGAEAAVETARLDLEWTRVRSPIAGRVGRAEVTAGNLVMAGPPTATLLTTVVSIDPIYVYFDGDEQTYLKYVGLAPSGRHPGGTTRPTTVFVGLANEDGFPHKGRIDFVDNHLDPAAGTIRARGVFSNADRLFTPGMFARIKLVGSGRYTATLIQDGAVGTDQDKKFVFVLKPDSTVDYRPIQLGRLTDGLRIVKSGLEPGEKIVVNGLQRVRPGMKVAVKEEPMAPDSTAAVPRETR